MPDVSAIKMCRDCSRELPLAEYHRNAQCKDGYRPECKHCVKAYRARYYERNQSQLREYSATFYQTNADGVKAYQKRYGLKYPDKIKDRGERYRAANRNRLLAEKKTDYQKNKARYAERSKAYRAQHPEYGRISVIKRRAKLKNASGTCTAAQWLAKCEYHGWRCYLCQTSLTFKEVETEHRKPISRGGSNWPANLAPACKSCNQAKGQKTEAEHLAAIR